MGPKAGIEIGRRDCRLLAGLCAAIALALTPSSDASSRAHFRHAHVRPAPARHVVSRPWPLEFPNSQYLAVKWIDVEGWATDEVLASFTAFRASCKPIAAERKPPSTQKTLGTSLREPCRAARASTIKDDAEARAFFERHFVALQISKLGDADGFVTGYYEPVLEGSKTPTDVFTVPVYRRPSNLYVRGVRQGGNLPNKGQVFRKIGRRKLVPYYDRAEIEDGALAGRGLEICYLKDNTDLLFMQIQGSGRIKLEDGSVLRLNYDAHNGQLYTPVGRILIERNIIAKEEMSMQRIHEWMDANPDGATELRRQNKSYVFFREVALSDKDEAVGAQGVPLTPQRSIAVDRSLHVYGTPFFLTGTLPLASEKSADPFRHLMIAQDTGSAITGPARADIYFGAGAEAGRVSGRFRHNIRFIILVPKALDPVVAGQRMGLPDPRPSEKIARLFPQNPAPSDKTVPDKPVAEKAPQDQTAQAAAPDKLATTSNAAPIPIPQARPEIPRDQPGVRRHRRHRT